MKGSPVRVRVSASEKSLETAQFVWEGTQVAAPLANILANMLVRMTIVRPVEGRDAPRDLGPLAGAGEQS